MKKHNEHIMWIDRGSKYIGIAYVSASWGTILPFGYLQNDGNVYFNIADVIMRYNVTKMVIGYPANQEDIQERINKFIKALLMIIDSEKTEIETMNEDYTSVEAGEIVSNFKKNAAEDTVSAMLILERWMEKEEE